MNGSVTLYSGPAIGPIPTDIAAGPDGALWVTNGGRTTITRMTTGGAVTNIGMEGHTLGIAAGPDGAMWFTAAGAVIGRITPLRDN